MEHYFDAVRETIAKLRDPKTGCPWDLEQTHQSLTPFLIEECYEYIHSLSKGKADEIREELGDILLQILLHARIKEEEEAFTIQDVCETLNEKMIRRHPHVFNDHHETKPSMNELHQQWEKIKQEEGKPRDDFFPEKDLNAPSLHASHKIGKRSTKISFDWENPDQVISKVEEELQEVKESLKKNGASPYQYFDSKLEEEIGDLLFSVAQLSRHCGFNSEITLGKANRKFINRFNSSLKIAEADGKSFESLNSEEKEQYWIQAKKNETL